VTKAISDLKIQKTSCLVVTVGGNDQFLRKGRTGFTEPIMSLFGEIISKVKEKSDKCVIVGLVPRMHLGGEAHSMAIAINRRLAGLCRPKNVQFLDPWDAFKGQRALFNADGIHLTDAGAKKFSRLVDARLPISLGNLVKWAKQGKPAMLKELAQKAVDKYHAARSDASGSTTWDQTRTPPFFTERPPREAKGERPMRSSDRRPE
jgi:hypothetical protein